MRGITQFVEIVYRNTQIRFKYLEKIGYLIKMNVRFVAFALSPYYPGRANAAKSKHSLFGLFAS